ncbi:Type I phosphodiesterase / nucleotide pyrophosphatase [Clavibacter michiganensis subsp. michiganensis]|nr:Type I phosphodiesterase / nucleotide pyrophosphatase [Clavibacter michiganensis subsp. michiganensis]
MDREPRALVYLYVPELDQAAHSHGWESDRWLRLLEELDQAAGPFLDRLGSREGALITADHGIVDVPAGSQVLFDRVPELVAGVRHVAGEPRCLHLHLEPGTDADALADAWRASEGTRAHVATRSEAMAADWYGPVRDDVAARIGDVVVATRSLIAYYDGRPRDQGARRMIGQHGSFSDEERLVPLIRAGAFAAADPPDDRGPPPGRPVGRRAGSGQVVVVAARAEHDLVPARHRRPPASAGGLPDPRASPVPGARRPSSSSSSRGRSRPVSTRPMPGITADRSGGTERWPPRGGTAAPRAGRRERERPRPAPSRATAMRSRGSGSAGTRSGARTSTGTIRAPWPTSSSARTPSRRPGSLRP